MYVFRGVTMAMKMPSRMLKKECAGILESMKVYKTACVGITITPSVFHYRNMFKNITEFLEQCTYHYQNRHNKSYTLSH